MYEKEQEDNIKQQLSEGHKLNCNGMIYNNFTLPAIKDSVVLWSDDAKCLREDWPDAVP